MRRRWIVAAAAALVLAVPAAVVAVQNTYDIREERVTIGSLDAVLATPSRSGPHGLVVFVHGDGPTDATHDGFYRPMWEEFARAGYASLSWSKPGVDGAPGNWLDQTMADRADEVRAALAWARGRADIDVDRMGLWGASQAGWVLPKVAASTPDVRFVIAVSTAVNWLDQGRFNLLADLRAAGAAQPEVDAAVARSDRTRALMREGASFERFQATVGDPDMTADRWRFNTTNFTSDATADLTALAGARVPVLLVLGGQDVNVDVADTEATYRRLLPAVQVRHYAQATHAIARPEVEASTLQGLLTGLFAPRQVFAAGFLADQAAFLP